MIEKVNIPEGTKGDWTVEKFTTDHFNFHYALQGRAVPKGETFTRLMRGKTLVMTDTPAEQRDHSGFYHRAQGQVLIAGLGIGMILEAVAKKPEVNRITVIEISQDLIDLVGPTYKERYGGKLEIICADILTWTPPPGKVFDAAWFDIWDEISEDNLPDMRKLCRRFGRKATWKGCWARPEIERQHRQSRRDEEMMAMFRRDNTVIDEMRKKLQSEVDGGLRI